MNTVVRSLPQRQFATRTQTRTVIMKQVLWATLLTMAVLVSAFAVVYFTDLHRRMFIQFQNLQDAQNQIYIDWGKLLLEQSTWSTQSRVQNVAEQRLHMENPQVSDVTIIKN